MHDWVKENFGETDSTGFRAELISIALDMDLFQSIINSDAMWALGSLIFVFFIFIVHLKSYFLALIGITLIVFSFPLTVLLCKSILQVDYIG